MKKDKKIGRPLEWTAEKRKELGEKLLIFCAKPHVFHIVQWTREEGKSTAWWHELKDRYKDLYECHNKAKEILGGKITQLAFENGNHWAIQTFLPMYLDDVKEHLRTNEEEDLDRRMRFEKYKNSLNQAKEEEAGAKIDKFDKSIEVAYELVKLRKFIESKGLLSELDAHSSP